MSSQESLTVSLLGVIIGYFLKKRSERLLRPLEDEHRAREEREKELLEEEEKRKLEEKEEEDRLCKEKQAAMMTNTSEEFSFNPQKLYTLRSLSEVPFKPSNTQQDLAQINGVILDEHPTATQSKAVHSKSLLEMKDEQEIANIPNPDPITTSFMQSVQTVKAPELIQPPRADVNKAKPWLTRGKSKSNKNNSLEPAKNTVITLVEEKTTKVEERNDILLNNTHTNPVMPAEAN